jgi:hypothetical protein
MTGKAVFSRTGIRLRRANISHRISSRKRRDDGFSQSQIPGAGARVLGRPGVRVSTSVVTILCACRTNRQVVLADRLIDVVREVFQFTQQPVQQILLGAGDRLPHQAFG